MASGKRRGVWPVQIPLAPRSPRIARGSPHHLLEGEAIRPAASVLAAGLAWRRAGRAHYRAKESETPCGKVRPDHATARPVDHRLTLDPCGLAYSLLRPPASTPKVVAARGWTTGLPPQAIATRRAETGPLDGLLRPREGWLGTRQAVWEKPQRRGRGPGSGRRPVQPAEAWSAVPAKGREAARTIFAIIEGRMASFLPFHKDYLHE